MFYDLNLCNSLLHSIEIPNLLLQMQFKLIYTYSLVIVFLPYTNVLQHDK